MCSAKEKKCEPLQGCHLFTTGMICVYACMYICLYLCMYVFHKVDFPPLRALCNIYIYIYYTQSWSELFSIPEKLGHFVKSNKIKNL